VATGLTHIRPAPVLDEPLTLHLNGPRNRDQVPMSDASALSLVMHRARSLWRLLPDGLRLADLSGRMLRDPADRDQWLHWLRQRLVSEPIWDVIDQHPRASWLDAGFNVATYLTRRPDVGDHVDTPAEAVFHYLEFGIEEGEHGRPDHADLDFVAARHGDRLPKDITAIQTLAALHHKGVDPLACPLNEAEHWALLGLDGQSLTTVFDHELYHAFAHAQGMQPSGHDRLACINHFVDIGLRNRIAIGDGLGFDPVFYRAVISDLALRAPTGDHIQTLYQHWASIGLRHGAQPNPGAWARAHLGMHLPPSWPDLRAALGLSQGQSDLDVLHKMAEAPKQALDGIDLTDSAQADAVMDLAEHLCRNDRHAEAKYLARTILQVAPDTPRALLRLAELHEGDLAHRHEVIAWRGKLAGLIDMPTNGLSLASLHLANDDVLQCIDLLCAIAPAIQGDLVQESRLRDLARQAYHRVWHHLDHWIGNCGVSQVQHILSRALVALTPPFSTPACQSPVQRVAIVGTGDLYQCKIYRMDQKADQLRQAGLLAQVFSGPSATADFMARRQDFDAVIFFRLPAFPHVIDAIVAAAEQGLLTFYDIDDLIFDKAVFPPPLDTYAGQLSARDHAAMACGVPLFAHAIALCDYGLASTEPIRAAMAGRVRRGQAFVHRNGLGAPHLAAMARAGAKATDPEAPVVVFYGSGTKAHKAEFHEVLEPSLAQLLRDRPGKVRIRLMGEFGDLKHLNPCDPAVEMVSPVWDFESYLDILATVDINLSILARSPATDAKSEIKWSEAAIFGIPSVVSPTTTLSQVIDDKVTGFLCDSSTAFAATLRSLVDDPAQRATVGAAAKAQVLRHYRPEVLGNALKSLFAQLRPVPRRKPKLLIVNVFYPPQAIGGATRVVHDNVTDLRQKYAADFDIEVLCTLEGGPRPYEVNAATRDGVRVWSVTAADGAETMRPQDPFMADVFARLIDQIAPDLIHFHCIQRLTASVVDVARLRGIPYVITPHDGWWVSPHQFVVDPEGRPETYDYSAKTLPDRAQILHRCLTDAAAILPVSEDFAELHRAAGLHAVTAVPNGVSVMPPIIRHREEATPVRLALIGGAARHKGFVLLRQAIEAGNFTRLHLSIVDHARLPGTEKNVVWGTTPVRFVPMLPQSRVAELYARMDVLLAPSIWPESFGLVAREALQAGLWVIASDRGAIGSDVIDGQNGHIVDVTDYDALMHVLAKVDQSPDVYGQSPLQAKPLRRSADQVDDLVRVYRRILNAPAN